MIEQKVSGLELEIYYKACGHDPRITVVFGELKVVGSKVKRNESEFWQKKSVLVILPLVSEFG